MVGILDVQITSRVVSVWIGEVETAAPAIFRMMTNMQYLVRDMDDGMRATTYGAGITAIPFSVLKFVFALIFVVVAAVQLMAIF